MNQQKLTSGFLLLDKPIDWTSFDVIAKLRSITGIKKIGHSGTLDPLATGLLIIAIGRDATKNINNFIKLDKTYFATIKLGCVSDTFDLYGTLHNFEDSFIKQNNYIVSTKIPTLQEIQNALLNFIGEIKQIPPMYSAKKINGQKLYELARKGIIIKREPSLIKIYSINLIDYNYPEFKIEVSCSSGTYIRSLANDIGQILKTGAYITQLRRTKINTFDVSQSITIDKITKENYTDFILKII